MNKLILIMLFIVNMFFSSGQYAGASQFSGDILVMCDSYRNFVNGNFENIELVNDKQGFLKLACGSSGFFSVGKYTSQVISMDFPVEEIFPSWNIICPKEKAGFQVYLRVSSDGSDWSGWFYMGSWGKCPQDKDKIIKDEFGTVKTDYLLLKKTAGYIQYSIQMFSSEDRQVSPEVKLFSLDCGKRIKGEIKSITENYRSPVKLNVPYRSQGDEDYSISGRICSPTSVAMVMEYWGVYVPTAEIAGMSYDKEHDIYGMWPVAVQAACQYGFKGWVQIFRNWEQVEKEIFRGRPVIATICFEDGKLRGSLTPASDGHVIVICGFDSHGNPICNDPAGENADDGIVIYDREELKKAWFEESGIGYIIYKE